MSDDFGKRKWRDVSAALRTNATFQSTHKDLWRHFKNKGLHSRWSLSTLTEQKLGNPNVSIYSMSMPVPLVVPFVVGNEEEIWCYFNKFNGELVPLCMSMDSTVDDICDSAVSFYIAELISST